MQVQVENALAGVRSNVQNGAVASPVDVALDGELCCDALQMPEKRFIFGGRQVQSGDVLAGYHQQVRGRLRIDIFEGNRQLVLEHDARRAFAAQDLTEKALLHRS